MLTRHDQLLFPVAYLGALAAGAVVAPIPIQDNITDIDVAKRLEQARVKLVVTSSSKLLLAECASELAGVIPLLALDPVGQRVPYLGDLLPAGDPDFHSFKLESAAAAGSHPAFLNRTSGSTGSMKTVITTHAHFIAVMEATRLTVPKNTEPDNDVWLSSLSLGFFINAKLNMGLNILLGIPVVLMQTPFNSGSLQVLARHKITFLFITPPLAADIAKADKMATNVSSIKWLLSAGAPMHQSLREAVSKQLNGVRVFLEWGTSETLLIAIQREEGDCLPGSSGTLVNGVEAKVIDVDSGEELGEMDEGELLVRNSSCRFAGYKDNDAANKDFDDEGWFHTGDLGHLDKGSNVYIKDRLKELLRVGNGYGSRISATELEAVVFEHAAVKSAVVTGIRDAATQIEHPTAFVILKPEYQYRSPVELSEEIERFANARLSGLTRLSGGVYFIPKYPTTGFKIDRRSLKGLVNIEAGRSTQPKYIEAS